MSLNAFKEPISLVSRHRSANCTGSPPRIRQRLSPSSRRTLVSSSKLLAALDAVDAKYLSSSKPKLDTKQDDIDECDVDSEGSSIEILRPPIPRHGYGGAAKESCSFSLVVCQWICLFN